MFTIEIAIRDYLVELYYKNNYGYDGMDINLTYDHIDFCAKGQTYRCFLAINSSTIVGIVVSFS